MVLISVMNVFMYLLHLGAITTEKREKARPRESPLTSPQAGGRALAYPRGIHGNIDTLAVFFVGTWHHSVVSWRALLFKEGK